MEIIFLYVNEAGVDVIRTWNTTGFETNSKEVVCSPDRPTRMKVKVVHRKVKGRNYCTHDTYLVICCYSGFSLCCVQWLRLSSNPPQTRNVADAKSGLK